MKLKQEPMMGSWLQLKQKVRNAYKPFPVEIADTSPVSLPVSVDNTRFCFVCFCGNLRE